MIIHKICSFIHTNTKTECLKNLNTLASIAGGNNLHGPRFHVSSDSLNRITNKMISEVEAEIDKSTINIFQIEPKEAILESDLITRMSSDGYRTINSSDLVEILLIMMLNLEESRKGNQTLFLPLEEGINCTIILDHDNMFLYSSEIGPPRIIFSGFQSLIIKK